MAGFKYTKIPTDTFQKLVMNAGIVCKNFDPSTKEASNQIGATTGGLQITCTPEFSDFGDDIDNCPKNMMELKKVVSYDVGISGTMLTLDANSVGMMVGAADVASGKITPRMNLTDADFNDLWVIADYSDENTGANAGYIACHIMNALNTGGFSLKTADKGKGQLAFTFTGHVSMDAQDVVPFEVYVSSGASETPYIVLDKKVISVAVNEEVNLGYEVNPSDASITFESSDTDKVTVTSAGKIKGIAQGNAIVSASITDSGVTYEDTCTVVVAAG